MSELNLVIPVNAQPTEALAARFSAWRRVIRQLNVYFKEVASVNEEVVKQNVRLGHAINFPFFSQGSSGHGVGDDVAETQRIRQMFLDVGEHSVSSVPSAAIEFHRAQAAAASRTAKELAHNVIPRLEDLRRDLVVKIKEIKSLASDFKNSVAQEQSSTTKELDQYSNSIETVSRSPSLLQARHDPYLLKTQVERALGRQVHEENMLLEAFINLQSSGRELEEVVAQEVQQALAVYGKLMGLQGKHLTDLSNSIMTGFVAKDPAFEWDAFVRRDSNFVDPHLRLRKADQIAYPHQSSLLASQIKAGYLERRSKYLKSYSRAWYVLTPSFFHEFKSSDRAKDPNPVMSLSLNDCQLSRDTRASSSSSHKFVLNTKQNGHHTHRGHNWVFRAESEEKLEEWYKIISRLTSLPTPVDRVQILEAASSGEMLPISPSVKDSASESRVSSIVPSEPTSRAVSGQHGAGGAAVGAAGASAPGSGSGSGPSASVSKAATGAGASTTAADASGVSGATVGVAGAGAAVGLGALAGSHSHDKHEGSTAALPPQSRVASYAQTPTGRLSDDDELQVSSPVLSETSVVTSNGEPFDAGPEQIDEPEAEEPDVGVAAAERPVRGRFPSEVKLESQPVDPDRAADDETLKHEATNFIVPSELDNSSTAVDNDSVFSYDLEHGTHSTLPQDKNFKPVDADLPIQVERRLTQTSHKNEDTYGIGVARSHSVDGEEALEDAVMRRRSSVTAPVRKLSRKATGSFGTEELRPLTSASNEKGEPGLFFANGLPSTTGGKEAH